MLDRLKNPKTWLIALIAAAVAFLGSLLGEDAETPPEEPASEVAAEDVDTPADDGSGTPSDELLPHSVAASELEGVDGSGDAKGSE